MKNVIKLFIASVVAGIGLNVGNWLWDNSLEEKVDSLKERFDEKFES